MPEGREIVKRHGCGASYTDAEWQRLRLVGHTMAFRGLAYEALELRECGHVKADGSTCRSCITRKLVRVPDERMPKGSRITVLEYAPVDEPAVEPAGGEEQDGQAQAAA